MSLGNIKLFGNPQTGQPGSIKKQVEASATLIYPGEPVKISAAPSPYVIKLADAEPVIGTTTGLYGIAQSTSTNTASANGTVDVWEMVPGVRYICAATVPANISTQAAYNLLVGNRVLFDLTAGVFTVDESTVDNAANGVVIEDSDIKLNPGQVVFTIRQAASYMN